MNVLILEDQIHTQVWLENIANTAFPTTAIKTANTLKEALHLITLDQFDIALIDFKLPDGTGVELISKIKQQTIPYV